MAAFLQELGVTLALARRIRQEFGDNAVQVLKHDPYVLTRMQGIGFQRADRMALSIGIQRNDPSRLRTALQYVLGEQTAREGHVFLPEQELVEEALKQVGPPATRDEVQAQLDLLIRDEDVIVTAVPGHARWHPQLDLTTIPADLDPDRGIIQGEGPSTPADGGCRYIRPGTTTVKRTWPNACWNALAGRSIHPCALSTSRCRTCWMPPQRGEPR